MEIENTTPQIEVETTTPDQVATTATEVADTGASEEQQQEEEKAFTQSELDAKIGERLAKEKRKWERQQLEKANVPAPMAEPKPADFKSQVEYIEAVATYKAEQIVAQREAEKQQKAVSESYADREETAREKYSDYEKVAYLDTKDGGPAISTPMAEVIMESEIGPEIAYYLGKNVEESKKIWAMKPLAQAAAIGKIEAALSAKAPAKPASSAPDPIKPVGGGRTTSASVNPSNPESVKKLSTEEWIAARNKQVQNRK